jgi:hypothetical protein
MAKGGRYVITKKGNKPELQHNTLPEGAVVKTPALTVEHKPKPEA